MLPYINKSRHRVNLHAAIKRGHTIRQMSCNRVQRSGKIEGYYENYEATFYILEERSSELRVKVWERRMLRTPCLFNCMSFFHISLYLRL